MGIYSNQISGEDRGISWISMHKAARDMIARGAGLINPARRVPISVRQASLPTDFSSNAHACSPYLPFHSE